MRKVHVLSFDGEKYKSLFEKHTHQKWSDRIIHIPTFQSANNWPFAKYWYEQIKIQQIMDELQKLLEKNHNLILTGAPGTGKTHLAKNLAKHMNAEWEMVQFHPSYDYTDFVEGLRPIKRDDSSQINFERKDGVFKKFCEKALRAYTTGALDNFEESWAKLLADIEDSSEEFIEVPCIKKNTTFKIEINTTGLTGHTKIENGWSQTPMYYNYDQLKNVYMGLPGVPKGGLDSYRKAIVKLMKEKYGLKEYVKGSTDLKTDTKPFVFIIDEINRGDIAKIFGELFFSIDKGYRGIEGAILTQYANLQTEPNAFDEVLNSQEYGHFFVPENVYIIGTMNDIDRNVESMDFAIRRRFIWKEIPAENSEDIINYANLSKEQKDEAKKRMCNLNNAIQKDENLGKSFCIGGSYFKDLEKYDGDFE